MTKTKFECRLLILEGSKKDLIKALHNRKIFNYKEDKEIVSRGYVEIRFYAPTNEIFKVGSLFNQYENFSIELENMGFES